MSFAFLFLVVLQLPSVIVSCISWAVLPQDRVLRAYVLNLLCDIAPQLDRVDIQRGIAGEQEYLAPAPPSWIELTQAISC